MKTPGSRGVPAAHRSGKVPAPRPTAGNAGKPAAARHETWPVETWEARLPAVLAAVGLAPSEAQQRALAGYMALLQRWNTTYNLTALRSPEDMLSHHLADCLVVVAPLLAHLGLDEALAQATPARFRLLDVGSGGGLPGVVLAILCPAIAVTCVDTVGKKAAFIRQVGAELGLGNLRAEHARVEQLQGQFDVVASRAFASLVDFVTWTRPLVSPSQGVWMAMKGRRPDEELAALPAWARLRSVENLQVPGLDAERCLVWLAP